MNKAILMGRLTREPEIRYSKGERCTPQKSMSVTLSSQKARRQQNRTRTGTTISTE